MADTYEVYVDNIGKIGEYTNLIRATQEAKSTIYNSARANNHYYILDVSGEIVAEGKHNAVARNMEEI